MYSNDTEQSELLYATFSLNVQLIDRINLTKPPAVTFSLGYIK